MYTDEPAQFCQLFKPISGLEKNTLSFLNCDCGDVNASTFCSSYQRSALQFPPHILSLLVFNHPKWKFFHHFKTEGWTQKPPALLFKRAQMKDTSESNAAVIILCKLEVNRLQKEAGSINKYAFLLRKENFDEAKTQEEGLAILSCQMLQKGGKIQHCTKDVRKTQRWGKLHILKRKRKW